jgi:hypothetical protein
MQLEKDDEDYEDDIENLTLTSKLMNDGVDITEPVSTPANSSPKFSCTF